MKNLPAPNPTLALSSSNTPAVALQPGGSPGGITGISSLVLPRHGAVYPRVRFGDYIEITRPRISIIVALTALAGYVTTATVINIAQALSLILSVALIAASATALNQVIERAVDSRMHRTRLRPLAQGRISCRSAVWLVCVLSLIGFTMLAQFNVESAFVAMAALAIYDFAYTPLKQISTVSLYVGAIPGALPPLVGSILAENRVSAHGVCLFAFMFLWQIPHFLAIGWIHRDDYRRAELHVLAAEDPGGFKSGSTALVTSTLLLAFIACAGGARLWGQLTALICGSAAFAMMIYAQGLLATRSRTAAKKLFLASNVCLLITLIAQMIAAALRF